MTTAPTTPIAPPMSRPIDASVRVYVSSESRPGSSIQNRVATKLGGGRMNLGVLVGDLPPAEEHDEAEDRRPP